MAVTWRHPKRALAAGLALGAALLPASVGAAPSVRWVDGDGRAGPDGCSGRQAASPTIQGAIDASPDDTTIKVCPGTYHENLVIVDRDAIRLVSVRDHQAVIRPVPIDVVSATSHYGILVTRSDEVLVRGFELVTPDDRHGTTCDFAGTSIYVLTAGHVIVEDNLLVGEGSAATTCGGGFIGLQHAFGEVIGNTIEDGIINVIEAPDSRVTHNEVRPPAGRVGIFEAMSGSLIAWNTILGPSGTTDASELPAGGIGVQDTSATVEHNRIRWVGDGIQALNVRSEVRSNDIRHGTGSGIVVSGGLVVDNVVRDFDITGIQRSGGTIRDNDFRHNDADGTIDCIDLRPDTGGSAWTNDLGDGSDPPGICTPPGH